MEDGIELKVVMTEKPPEILNIGDVPPDILRHIKRFLLTDAGKYVKSWFLTYKMLKMNSLAQPLPSLTENAHNVTRGCLLGAEELWLLFEKALQDETLQELPQ